MLRRVEDSVDDGVKISHKTESPGRYQGPPPVVCARKNKNNTFPASQQPHHHLQKFRFICSSHHIDYKAFPVTNMPPRKRAKPKVQRPKNRRTFVSHGGDISRLPQNIQEEARRIKSDIEKRAARMEAGRDPSEETEADISPEEQERLDKGLEEKGKKAKEEEEKKRQEKGKQEAEKKRQEEEARATDEEEEVPRTAAPGCELVNVEVEKTTEATFTIDQNRLDRVLTNCQTDDQLLAEYQRHAFRIEEVLGAAHHTSAVLETGLGQDSSRCVQTPHPHRPR